MESRYSPCPYQATDTYHRCAKPSRSNKIESVFRRLGSCPHPSEAITAFSRGLNRTKKDASKALWIGNGARTVDQKNNILRSGPLSFRSMLRIMQ